jgi:hypothetical protein
MLAPLLAFLGLRSASFHTQHKQSVGPREHLRRTATHARRKAVAARTVEGCNVLMIDELAKVKKVRVGDGLLDESNCRPASRPIRKDEILPGRSVRALP